MFTNVRRCTYATGSTAWASGLVNSRTGLFQCRGERSIRFSVKILKGKRLVFRFSCWCNQKRKTNRFSFARCAFLIDKTVQRADF